MNSLGKKAGYLKGLLEGLSFADPAQEKLLRAVVDLLNDLCDRVEAVDDLLEDLNDYVESIDEDLSLLEGEHEDDFHPFDDEDFEDDMDDMSVPDRLHLIGGKDAEEDDVEEDEDDDVEYVFDSDDADGDDEEDDDGEDIAGVLCPDCRHPFFIGLEDAEGATYVCPHCGHRVTPEPLTSENAPIARPAEDDGE